MKKCKRLCSQKNDALYVLEEMILKRSPYGVMKILFFS